MRAGALAVAVALDTALAEPPLRLHPVVWAGRYLSWAGARLPAGPPGRAVAAGGLAWAGGALVSAGTGLLVARAVRRLPPPVDQLVSGVALWPLLSGRMLLAEVAGVESELTSGLPAGRTALARIVSRETAALTPAQVRAAAVESLAENLSDSLVATLFWAGAAGLPGAALHRFANTADAMWGYRSQRWEHAGKVAARVDDLLNVVPARLTALLLAGPRPGLLRRTRAEARRTPSPNGGWPMGALALRLDLRLAKEGVYVLNPDGAEPGPDDLRAALEVARRAALAAVPVAVLVAVLVEWALDARPRHPSRPGTRPSTRHPPPTGGAA